MPVHIVGKQIMGSFRNLNVLSKQGYTILLKLLWHTKADFGIRKTAAGRQSLMEHWNLIRQDASAQQAHIRFPEHGRGRVQFPAVVEDEVVVMVKLVCILRSICAKTLPLQICRRYPCFHHGILTGCLPSGRI